MRTFAILGIFLGVLGAFYLHPGNAQQGDGLRENLERLGKLASEGLHHRASKWRCEAAAKFHCSTKGCEEGAITVWVNLDFPARRYERCDAKGCDEYQMTYSTAGIYTTVWPEGRSTLLKVLNDGNEFMEVASLGRGAFISFGRCTPGR